MEFCAKRIEWSCDKEQDRTVAQNIRNKVQCCFAAQTTWKGPAVLHPCSKVLLIYVSSPIRIGYGLHQRLPSQPLCHRPLGWGGGGRRQNYCKMFVNPLWVQVLGHCKGKGEDLSQWYWSPMESQIDQQQFLVTSLSLPLQIPSEREREMLVLSCFSASSPSTIFYPPVLGAGPH